MLSEKASHPKRGEQPLEHAGARPAAEPGADRGPVAAVLREVRKRVDEGAVRNPHVAALNRQAGVDSGAMFCRDLFNICAPLDLYFITDNQLSKIQAKLLRRQYLMRPAQLTPENVPTAAARMITSVCFNEAGAINAGKPVGSTFYRTLSDGTFQ